MKNIQVSLGLDDNKIIVRVVGADKALLVMTADQAAHIAGLILKAVEEATKREAGCDDWRGEVG